MLYLVYLLTVIGLAVSCYAFFIETKIKKEPGYKPACDISDTVSCSKPLLSKYGNLFFISNSLAGIFFYSVMFVLAVLGYKQLLFYFSSAALLVSIYLSYILFTKIKSLCLICSAIYLINILLFVTCAFFI